MITHDKFLSKLSKIIKNANYLEVTKNYYLFLNLKVIITRRYLIELNLIVSKQVLLIYFKKINKQIQNNLRNLLFFR